MFYSVWSCFTQEKNTKVYTKQFAFDPTTFKVEENSRTYTEIQGLFKDSPKNSRTFQVCANPVIVDWARIGSSDPWIKTDLIMQN